MSARAAWFVPGRIEVLGKHTDYAGGRSLLGAVERGFRVVSVPRPDNRIVVADRRRAVTFTAALEPGLVVPEDGWANYAMTVARRIARDFPDARRGADISLESDLPASSGMSSSSAMMIGIFLALADANQLAADPAAASIYRSPEALADYLAAVENGQRFEQHADDRGVGTSGGSEDHTAILCCTAGALAQYAFCPVRRERVVTLDRDLVFAIAVSGVRANKTGPARGLYNDATGAVARMLEVWRATTRRDDEVLADALASEPQASERLRRALHSAGHAALVPRLDQFIEESEVIVPAAAARLADGNIGAFGVLVDRSQALAERALGNQMPETIALARSARVLGAPAASTFGAGFGGSVWALVPATDAEPFIERWSAGYRRAFPRAASRASFFTTRPGPGVTRLE